MDAVILKRLVGSAGRYGYYVRPAQPLGADKKFQSDEWVRRSYKYIKALKSILGVDLNSYLLKKLFMRPAFRTIKFGATKDGMVIFKMLSQPELRRKFESVIDFEQWAREPEFSRQFIPLRK